MFLGTDVTPEQPSVMDGKGGLSLSLSALPSLLVPIPMPRPRAGSPLPLVKLALPGVGLESRCCLLSVPEILVRYLLPISLFCISDFII